MDYQQLRQHALRVWLAVLLVALNARAAEWGPWADQASSAVDRYTPAALNRTIAEEPNPLKLAGLVAIRAYQLGGAGSLSACQFAPSCSRYTFGAIATCGLLQGSILGAERISRCHGFAALGDYPEAAAGGRFADPVDGSRPLVPWLSRLGL